MFSKIFVVAVVVASALAGPIDHHGATSYSSYNQDHNSVHHIDSAPALLKAAPVYSTSAYHASAYSAPAYHHDQAYSAPTYTEAYAAPAAKLAPPVVKVAPVAKYVSPVAKAVSPVAHYAHAHAPAYYDHEEKYAPAKVVSPVAHYAHAPAYYDHEEKYAPAQYKFSYAVQDPHTGDFHSQEEHRDGDHVVGQYSLHEADGTIRIVKYSDDGHGFQAVVEKQGEPTPAPAQYKKLVVPVAKAVVAAPDYHHY